MNVKVWRAKYKTLAPVDTKKKELVDFKNGGRQWRLKGQPTRVRVHDFLMPNGPSVAITSAPSEQNKGAIVGLRGEALRETAPGSRDQYDT